MRGKRAKQIRRWIRQKIDTQDLRPEELKSLGRALKRERTRRVKDVGPSRPRMPQDRRSPVRPGVG